MTKFREKGYKYMMKIAICDDEHCICSQIENILLKYARRNYIKVDTEVFYSGESILNYFSKGDTFDLIFLDIEMEKIDGIEVGQQIRKIMRDYTTEIVYISGKDAYYKRLFDVQPLNFIEKPIPPQSVIDAFELAAKRLKKFFGFFQYQKRHETYKVEINNILYFESFNREVKIVLSNREDLFYGNLEDISFRVSGYPFLKIHRSYLINYNHTSILRYTEVVMSNGAVLPISRNRRQEIRNIQINKREDKNEY